MRGHVRKRCRCGRDRWARCEHSWSVVIDRGRANGRRKQSWLSGFSTKRDAEKALTEALGRLDKGSYVAPSKETLEEFLVGEWLPAIRSTVRGSTFDSYRRVIEGRVLPTIGGIRLQALSAADLNRLYADLLESGKRNGGGGGLSPRSVRYVHVIVRRALRDALRWDRITRNVADAADPPKSRTPEMRVWSVEELRSFLRHVEGDDLYPLYVLGAASGMRRGELLGLRWRDVDLDEARVTVRRSATTIGGRIVVTEPKSGKGRSIDLDPETVRILRTHRSGQKVVALDGLVFSRKGEPIHPDQWTREFRRHVRKASLPDVGGPHSLRHLHATLLLAAGVHPKVAQERLGHASVTLTLNTYSHVIPTIASDAATRFGGVVFG
jgi:integrase